MYARVLRKWSLAKFLMYLWLPVMMLLVIWCQGAASMHLTTINGGAPISQFQRSPTYFLGSTYNSNDNQLTDYHNSLSQLYNHRQIHPRHSGYADAANAAAASNAAASFVPNVPKLNSQIINNHKYNINHSYNSNNYSRNLITSANINLIINGRKYKRHVQDQQIYNTPATSTYTMRGGSTTRRFYPTEPTRITRTPIYPVMRKDNVQIRSGYVALQRNNPYRSYRNDQIENVGSRIIDIVTTSASTSTSTVGDHSSSPILTTNRLIPIQQNENEIKNIGLKENNNNLKRDNEQYRNINATPPDQADWLYAQREKRIRNESLRRRLIREHIILNNTRDTNLRRSNSDGSLNSNNYNNNSNNNNNNINNNNNNINTSSNIVRHMSDSDLDELMIGRNRRDSRYYPSSISSWQVSSSGNRQRKRQRRYCSARDPTQLAFEAPTVFEGKVRSMSSDRRRNFSVTFEVKEIYKKQLSYSLPSLLRLQFTYRNTTSECDIYREHLRPRGLVRDELEQGRIYILFVQQIDIGNFTILGTPVKKTKRAVNAVKIGVSKDYAQPASIKSLTANRSNRTVIQEGEELRIVCKVKGQPPPKVTWFKDDKSINRNRKMYQFIHLKKRSELVISSFKTTDAGHYECRAKNKVTKKPDRRVIRIDAAQKPTRRNEETFSHLTGDQCPEEWQAYCLNGATCKYFKDVSLCSCTCPDGYIGDRCQTKEPTTFEPNPTFHSRYMADGPPVDVHDDDEDDLNDSEEYHTTLGMSYYSKSKTN